MIVDSPKIIDLAVGTGRIVPNSRDSQIEIPPLVIPTLPIISQHEVLQSSIEPPEGSFLTQIEIDKNNAAAGLDHICILRKGYWDLSWRISARYNQLSVQFAILVLTYQGFSVPLQYLGANAEVINTERSVRLLLRDTGDLDFSYIATGAGDFINVRCAILATRLI